jgi:transcriptional regulator NrdR family protein
MKCSQCGQRTRIINCDYLPGRVRRRRECQYCEHKETTYELRQADVEQFHEWMKNIEEIRR